MTDRNPRHEYLDDTPMALPLKFRRQSWIDNMREFVRSEMMRQSMSMEAETFEEADDFYVEDDDTLPRTPYELDADQEYYIPAEPDPAPASPTPDPAPAAPSSEAGTEAG